MTRVLCTLSNLHNYGIKNHYRDLLLHTGKPPSQVPIKAVNHTAHCHCGEASHDELWHECCTATLCGRHQETGVLADSLRFHSILCSILMVLLI